MQATKSLLAVASLALLAATGAHADEADGSQFAIKFDGSRTRAEVMAEAANVARTRSTEPAGSRVLTPVKSTVDVQALRASTIQSVRNGQISQGEFTY